MPEHHLDEIAHSYAWKGVIDEIPVFYEEPIWVDGEERIQGHVSRSRIRAVVLEVLQAVSAAGLVITKDGAGSYAMVVLGQAVTEVADEAEFATAGDPSMPDRPGRINHELATEHAEAAVRVLREIMMCTGNPSISRVAAAEVLLKWASGIDGGRVPECDGTDNA
ncbi:MAG TPA: hypothetical protein VM537_05765 [Anaerolineae bacterium]|nr:hypothetical protein [Anaerolineae bacterium]